VCVLGGEMGAGAPSESESITLSIVPTTPSKKRWACPDRSFSPATCQARDRSVWH
jgi:hypothetical protein